MMRAGEFDVDPEQHMVILAPARHWTDQYYKAAEHNMRRGHIYEHLSRLRRFCDGNDDGLNVDAGVWVADPAPGKDGHVIEARRKTVGEVFDELVALAGRTTEFGPVVEGAEEYFTVHAAVSRDDIWPRGRTIVFPVTGGSEGWYVHVEVQTEDGKSPLLILGKGFDGPDAAWALARRLADMLGV